MDNKFKCPNCTNTETEPQWAGLPYYFTAECLSCNRKYFKSEINPYIVDEKMWNKYMEDNKEEIQSLLDKFVKEGNNE